MADEMLKVLTDKLTQRDKALADSEKRLRYIIDSIPEFIVEIDLNGIRRFVSSPVEKVLGYSAEYYIGKSCYEGMHPDDVITSLNKLAKGIETQTNEIAFYRYLNKDNNYVMIEATCTPVYDSVNKLIGVLTVNRKIENSDVERIKQIHNIGTVK